MIMISGSNSLNKGTGRKSLFTIFLLNFKIFRMKNEQRRYVWFYGQIVCENV